MTVVSAVAVNSRTGEVNYPDGFTIAELNQLPFTTHHIATSWKSQLRHKVDAQRDEPGRIRRVVRPPLRIQPRAGSLGSIASTTRTCAH